jgi:hypothetical protein
MKKNWVTKSLGEVIKLEYGKPLPKEDRDSNGAYPAYGANGVKCRTNKFLCDEPSIIVGRKGSAGEVTLTEEKYWPLDVTYFVTFDPEQYDLIFLFHCLKSLSLQKLAKGVKPGINRNDVYDLEFSFPPISEQKEIVKIIEDASEQAQHLRDIYEKKLEAVTELERSIIHQAFEGKLEKHTSFTASPEFGAHVIAYGYHWHEGQRKNRSYGHVKTQKFLHLAESIANVDMGRQPIKDAAGPNDFQHMLRAEGWAKSNLFFEFTPRLTGNGYDFKKLGDYNKLIGGALEAVKPYKDKLEKILALMMPMNTREAEVLATVHAAWNNLLLDNVKITDDAIIHEARENWTESKRSIPENEFRKAITTIRNNGIVPDGTAKRVTGQESLPL